MSVPSWTSCPTIKRVASRNIKILTERDWNQESCLGKSTLRFILFYVMYISGAKFEDYRSNISRDILDSVFYHFSCAVYHVITFLICMIQKR